MQPFSISDAPLGLIPEGDHLFQVICAETEPSSNGATLMLVLEVLAGPYQQRRCSLQLRVGHQNAFVRWIAQDTMRSLIGAIGIASELDDPQQMLRIPFWARASIVEKDEMAVNRVTNFRPREFDAIRLHAMRPQDTQPDIA